MCRYNTYVNLYYLPSTSRSSTDLEGDMNLCDDGVTLLWFSPCALIGDL